MKTINTSRRQQIGFSIVEALIALAIMGFGILGLAGLQAALSRNSDVAKQRTEAMRLAQEKIEQFRSLTGITATAIVASQTVASAPWNNDWNGNWNTLSSGSDVPSNNITTNAVYTRTWTLSNNASDPAMLDLTVNVVWSDRAGETVNVSLSTILAKSNPADAGFLGFPLPQNTNLKRPKNRNLDIPIPSIDLGDGKSAMQLKNTDQYILFDNITGDLTNICTTSLNSSSSINEIISTLKNSSDSTKTSANLCPEVKGYIVAGYVSRHIGNNNTPGAVSDTDWNAIKDGLGIDYSGITRNAAGSSAIACQFGDAINQNTNSTIANYKYYLCVIPLEPPTPNAPYNWSGTVRIAGPSVWNTSGNKYYVCRYQYTATNSLTDPNQRNVQPYNAVNKSIDQQNYLIATAENNTSATAPACPNAMSVTGVSVGVLHQDCRSASNANYATACPLRQ